MKNCKKPLTHPLLHPFYMLNYLDGGEYFVLETSIPISGIIRVRKKKKDSEWMNRIFFDSDMNRRGDAWKIRTSTAAHQSLRLLQSEGTHPCSPFLRPDFEEIREDDSDRNLNLNDTRDQNIFKLAFFFGAKWAAFYPIWIAAQSHDGCPVKFYLDWYLKVQNVYGEFQGSFGNRPKTWSKVRVLYAKKKQQYIFITYYDNY